MARIDAFLKLGLAQGCSDVHLAVGVPPMLRLHGDLMPIKFRDLGDAELEGYVDEILTESQRERFRAGVDLDFSYVSANGFVPRRPTYSTSSSTSIQSPSRLCCQIPSSVRRSN